jgi:hypothetical protein
MDIKTLKETILAAKLHPIFVDGSAHEESSSSNRFIGSLDEYLAAIQALSAPAVFFRISRLEESMFFYELDTQDDFAEEEDEKADETDESGEVDLRLINKELLKFEERIGSIATYQLTCGLGSDALEYVIDEPWWLDLDGALSSTRDSFDSNVEAMRAKARKEAQSRNLNTIRALHKLIDDNEFVILKTQKAMIAYAKLRIPELEHLDEFALKREVQEMDALINARGLKKKR